MRWEKNWLTTICSVCDLLEKTHTNLGGKEFVSWVIETAKRVNADSPAQLGSAVTRQCDRSRGCCGRSELTYLWCRVPVVLQFISVLSLSVICGPQRLASGIIASIGYGKVMGHVNTLWFTLQDLSLQRLHVYKQPRPATFSWQDRLLSSPSSPGDQQSPRL